MTTPEHHIDSVAFTRDGGVVINYTTLPGDSRGRTAVMMTHVIAITSNDQYSDGIDEIEAAILGLLQDVLEDWPTMPIDDPVYELAQQQQAKQDDDDELGMGERPADRT